MNKKTMASELSSQFMKKLTSSPTPRRKGKPLLSEQSSSFTANDRPWFGRQFRSDSDPQIGNKRNVRDRLSIPEKVWVKPYFKPGGFHGSYKNNFMPGYKQRKFLQGNRKISIPKFSTQVLDAETEKALDKLKLQHCEDCTKYVTSPSCHPSYVREENAFIKRQLQKGFKCAEAKLQWHDYWRERVPWLNREIYLSKRRECLEEMGWERDRNDGGAGGWVRKSEKERAESNCSEKERKISHEDRESEPQKRNRYEPDDEQPEKKMKKVKGEKEHCEQSNKLNHVTKYLSAEDKNHHKHRSTDVDDDDIFESLKLIELEVMQLMTKPVNIMSTSMEEKSRSVSLNDKVNTCPVSSTTCSEVLRRGKFANDRSKLSSKKLAVEGELVSNQSMKSGWISVDCVNDVQLNLSSIPTKRMLNVSIKHSGLDIAGIARATIGKDTNETVEFIRHTLENNGNESSDVSNSQLMEIFMDVTAAQMQITADMKKLSNDQKNEVASNHSSCNRKRDRHDSSLPDVSCDPTYHVKMDGPSLERNVTALNVVEKLRGEERSADRRDLKNFTRVKKTQHNIRSQDFDVTSETCHYRKNQSSICRQTDEPPSGSRYRDVNTEPLHRNSYADSSSHSSAVHNYSAHSSSAKRDVKQKVRLDKDHIFNTVKSLPVVQQVELFSRFKTLDPLHQEALTELLQDIKQKDSLLAESIWALMQSN